MRAICYLSFVPCFSLKVYVVIEASVTLVMPQVMLLEVVMISGKLVYILIFRCCCLTLFFSLDIISSQV